MVRVQDACADTVHVRGWPSHAHPAPPPPPPPKQVSYGVGSAVVNVFAAIDDWLEKKHWFTTLVPQPFPSEVMDVSTGSIKGECRQVGVLGGRVYVGWVGCEPDALAQAALSSTAAAV